MQTQLLPIDGSKARTIKCGRQWGGRRAIGQGRVNNNSNCCCCIWPRHLSAECNASAKDCPNGLPLLQPSWLGGWSRSNLPSTEDAMAAAVPISYWETMADMNSYVSGRMADSMLRGGGKTALAIRGKESSQRGWRLALQGQEWGRLWWVVVIFSLRCSE